MLIAITSALWGSQSRLLKLLSIECSIWCAPIKKPAKSKTAIKLLRLLTVQPTIAVISSKKPLSSKLSSGSLPSVSIPKQNPVATRLIAVLAAKAGDLDRFCRLEAGGLYEPLVRGVLFLRAGLFLTAVSGLGNSGCDICASLNFDYKATKVVYLRLVLFLSLTSCFSLHQQKASKQPNTD